MNHANIHEGESSPDAATGSTVDTATDPEERRKGIGGSDAGAILGVSCWTGAPKTPLELWLKKTGKVEDDPAGEPAEWGGRNEAAVLRKLAEELKVCIIGRDEWGDPTAYLANGSRQMIFEPEKLLDRLTHPELDFMRGHVDGFVVNDDGEPIAFVEVKTASEWKSGEWGEVESDEIPPSYRVQVVHYSVVLDALGWTDLPWHVGVLIGGNRFKRYVVKPTAEEKAHLIAEEKIFWSFVQMDIPPPVSGANDEKALNIVYPEQDKERTVVVGDDSVTRELGHELRDVKAKLKKATARESELKALIKEVMEDADEIVSTLWRATWRKSKDGVTVAWKAIVSEIEEASKKRAVSKTAIARIIKSNSTEKEGNRVFNFYEVKTQGEEK